MHPYLHEQMMKAHCDELHGRTTRDRGGMARPRHRSRPPLRHDVGWLLVHVGLRLALGPGQHRPAAHRAGAAQPG